ncbi:MAG: hypothetical protein JNM60_10745 [Candidatus Competibacteraceae bacterium]|nr:hypothetical protein [Candidatus Competibacteraceae bacterium]
MARQKLEMGDFHNLSVDLRPSRLLLIGGAALHLLAGVAVVFSGVPHGAKAGFIALLVWSLASLGFRHGLRRSPGFIAGIDWLDGRWRLRDGKGGRRPARLIGGYAHPLIVILNFRPDNAPVRSLALLPDAADAESLRRLRVLLRIWRDADAEDGAPG